MPQNWKTRDDLIELVNLFREKENISVVGLLNTLPLKEIEDYLFYETKQRFRKELYQEVKKEVEMDLEKIVCEKLKAIKKINAGKSK